MRSRFLTTRVGLALLLVAVALLAVGCGERRGPAPVAVPTTEATAAALPVTATPGASGQEPAAGEGAAVKAPSAGTGSAQSPGSGLTSSQAGTLDAELSAIESELDRLSLPGENDFDSIGSGLK